MKRGERFPYRGVVAAALLLLSLSAPVMAMGGMTFLSPKEGSFVESPRVNLVIRTVFKGSDVVRLAVNNREIAATAAYSGDFHLSYCGVPLDPGMNSVRVSLLRNGKIVEEKVLSVFFRSDISHAAGTAPAGYSRYFFHVPASEPQCNDCHGLDFSATDDNPSKPEKSPCFTCHGKLMSGFRMAHGPAAVWSCTACHDPKSSDRKLAVRKPDEKVCSECHEYGWLKMRHVHGPVAAGSCTTCHNPHGANCDYFLRLGTADLCASCHEEVLEKPHVISGFSAKPGHPVRLSPDPLNPGRDFTCASCHNPHATDYPLMLKSDHNDMYEFCQSCHTM